MAEQVRLIQRLVDLHQIFAKKRKLSWSDIQTQYEESYGEKMSKRTIYNDIQRLRDQFGAPLVSENKLFYYETDFSIFDLLNPVELKLAEDAGHLLNQWAILPPMAGMEDIHVKIRERLRKSPEQPQKLVDFERNDQYYGLKWLTPFYKAIQQQTTVKVVYQDFGKSPRTFSMSPYLLKEYRNRWHIYGFEHTRNRLYNLALDRVHDIKSSEFSFRTSKLGELQFLDEIVGFTITYNAERESYEPVEEIDLAIRRPRAEYLRTKPLHGSQRELRNSDVGEDWVVFRYALRQNRELVAAILELGQDAWVRSPVSLQEKVKAHLQGMLALYQTDASAKE